MSLPWFMKCGTVFFYWCYPPDSYLPFFVSSVIGKEEPEVLLLWEYRFCFLDDLLVAELAANSLDCVVDINFHITCFFYVGHKAFLISFFWNLYKVIEVASDTFNFSLQKVWSIHFCVASSRSWSVESGRIFFSLFPFSPSWCSAYFIAFLSISLCLLTLLSALNWYWLHCS